MYALNTYTCEQLIYTPIVVTCNSKIVLHDQHDCFDYHIQCTYIDIHQG